MNGSLELFVYESTGGMLNQIKENSSNKTWIEEGRLVFFAALGLSVGGVHADLFVVLLEGRHVLAGLRELSLLHALADIPVDEGTLGVHEVELVVKTSPGFGDGRGVGQHAQGSGNLGQISAGNDGGRLVVDANLEAGGAPVDELDGPLGLDGRDGRVDVPGNDVSAVEKAARHVLAVTGVALDHLVGRLEAGVGDLANGQAFVEGLFGGDDRSIRDQGEVDPGVGHQVGLELCQVNVEGAVEAERGRDGGHNLADETVEVGVGGTVDVELSEADVVDGLVVDHEGTVRVFQSRVGSQDGVVGLDDCGGHLGRGVDGEFQLGLLAVVNRQALHQERGESGSGASSERVEDKETLETGATFRQDANSVENEVDDLLSDGVVASGVVVGGIFLAGDQLARVEQLAVGADPDLIDDGGFEIDKDGSGNVLSASGLGEEGRE